MKSRAFGAVLLCLQIFLVIVDFSSATEEESTATVTDSSNAGEHTKLLLDCQHPDYRTYIKCLKRHKRHHLHGEHGNEGGDSRNRCFRECGLDQCESTKCVHDCHRRCMKKTKETSRIITEYETTCETSECKDEEGKTADLPATNITTNIDINNVIHNHMPKVEPVPTSSTDSTGSTGTISPPRPTGMLPPTSSPPHEPHCWWCGFSLVPQIQFIPVVTFGVGGFGGGGYWPGQPFPNGKDCWSCGNPLWRYRCDVSCYALEGTGHVMQNPAVHSGCRSPQCVGGT